MREIFGYSCPNSSIRQYDMAHNDDDNNIDVYSTQHILIDDICVASSFRELCESRDSEYTNFFDGNESCKLIVFLCILHKPIYIFYWVCIYCGCILVLSCYFHTHFIYLYCFNFFNIMLYFMNVRIKILL